MQQYFVKNWSKNLSTNRRMHCIIQSVILISIKIFTTLKFLFETKVSRTISQYVENTSARPCVGRFLNFQESLYIRACCARNLQIKKCQEKEKPPKPKLERSPDRPKPDFSSPSAVFTACSARLAKINYFFSINTKILAAKGHFFQFSTLLNNYF